MTDVVGLGLWEGTEEREDYDAVPAEKAAAGRGESEERGRGASQERTRKSEGRGEGQEERGAGCQTAGHFGTV